jgi:amino acid adenylation domain-containing protein
MKAGGTSMDKVAAGGGEGASPFPLTLTQNDIYLDQFRHGGSPLYNVGGYIRLGAVDAARLAEAHRRLVSEQDVFGIRVSLNREGVFQSISPDRTTSLTTLDFSREKDPAGAADAWQTSLFETAFDVADAELFSAYLLKLGDDRHRYLGRAHHLMMDGWGFSNWAKLLCRLYNDPSAPAPAPLPWREIALDDRRYVGGEKYTADGAYWAGQMRHAAPPLLSPRYQGAFPDAAKVPSRRKIIELSRAEFDELKALAESLGAGVSHYFLAVLAVYFAHTSGQDRLVFGLPFHNRRGHVQKQMLGVFTSVSPLGLDLKGGGCTFGELARDIGRQQKANFRHQRYPLGHIVRDLPDLGGRRTLYEVGFNYLRLEEDLSFEGEPAGLVYLSHNHEATPLMFTVCEHGEFGPVQLQLDYNLAYLNDADVALLADRLTFLMRSLPGALSARVADLPILPAGEVRRLLEGFGDGPPPETFDGCIHQLFEEQARRTPDAVAVTSREESLTYEELNGRANRVAHHLVGLGVGPESLVGLCMRRSADVLVGILGILKAGGAYVPLDPSHPPQRILTILEDAGVRLVLTHRRLQNFDGLPAGRALPIDEIQADASLESRNPDAAALGLTPANLAYVIYTSGSTGKPKGVQICHFNTVALLDWTRGVYTPEELDRVLFSTSLNFDLSVFEMFAPLSVGGRCVVVDDALDLLDAGADVSLINTVPSAIKVLIEQDGVPEGVSVINLAGEPLPMGVVNDLLSARKCGKVFNLYGPSEDTTYTTYALFTETLTDAPSIGRAISGTRLYVLSPGGKLTPTGAVGELHIAGSGLARGYLNSPGLTAEKFINGSLSGVEGERWYRTGDLVRYRADGTLEYLGRADTQVKIRGFRVELGEIQKQLEQLEGVKTAVVLVRERGPSDKYLSAYVERRQNGAGLPDEEWADWLLGALRASLPDYMVPASVTVLGEMPLTPNGKVDKKALLALGGEAARPREYVPPKTDTEVRLVEMWAQLLGVRPGQVGTTTSLYDLGGHSLLLVRLANDVQAGFGVKLPVRSLFDVVNLGDLARRIDAEMRLQLVEQKMNSATVVSEGYL